MSKPKLLVVVQGGMVQSVQSEVDMELVICDRDNIEAADEEEPVFDDGTTVNQFFNDAEFGLW